MADEKIVEFFRLANPEYQKFSTDLLARALDVMSVKPMTFKRALLIARMELSYESRGAKK